MATSSVSSDVSTNINITARKFDSFYLQVTITYEDGTAFSFADYDVAKFDITNANGVIVKTFSNSGNPLTSTTDTVKPGTIKPLVLNTTDGVLTLYVPYSTSTLNSDPVLKFINMNILVGTYDYVLYLTGSSERSTIMHGKFKVIE